MVFATAARLEVRARPDVYACTHLANSASLLLPVSNLTNLLAFAASGLAFGRFAALMAVPWLAAIAVEYAVFGRFFASDLNTGDLTRRGRVDRGRDARLPVVTFVVVARDRSRRASGPNLASSLPATLLWRRIAHHHGSAPDLGEFTRLGLLTVPAALVLAVLALWAGLHLREADRR